LLDFAKEMIRESPDDMVRFSRLYFEKLLKASGYFEEKDAVLSINIGGSFEIVRNKNVNEEFKLMEVVDIKPLYRERRAVNRKNGVERIVKIVPKEKNMKYSEFIN
jgi:hypothetical protein